MPGKSDVKEKNCKTCEWFEGRDTTAWDWCHRAKGFAKPISDWTKGCRGHKPIENEER